MRLIHRTKRESFLNCSSASSSSKGEASPFRKRVEDFVLSTIDNIASDMEIDKIENHEVGERSSIENEFIISSEDHY